MTKSIQAGVFLAVLFFASSLCAQGTIIFHNRNLSSPMGGVYNADIFVPFAEKAQLYLVTGAAGSEAYTPIEGLQSFRPAPNNMFFAEPLQVMVPGQAPGTTGLRFVVRAWSGVSYDTAQWRGQSAFLTIHQPLGGPDPGGGPPIVPPNLGGTDGLQGFVLIPEPRLIGFVFLAVAGLCLRRRK